MLEADQLGPASRQASWYLRQLLRGAVSSVCRSPQWQDALVERADPARFVREQVVVIDEDLGLSPVCPSVPGPPGRAAEVRARARCAVLAWLCSIRSQ